MFELVKLSLSINFVNRVFRATRQEDRRMRQTRRRLLRISEIVNPRVLLSVREGTLSHNYSEKQFTKHFA